MAVYQELGPGDTLLIGNGTRITLVAKTGQRARLKIESDADIDRIKAGAPLPVVKPPQTTKSPAHTDSNRPFLQRQKVSA